MKKTKFKTFDASPYPTINWVPGFLNNIFGKPKEYPMWDAAKPDQRERLQSFADALKQWLASLPDGAEVGTTELAKGIHPARFDEELFRKFVINRIGQCRFYEMLDGFYYTIPDLRWKTPRTFYKYHNGKGKLDDENAIENLR